MKEFNVTTNDTEYVTTVVDVIDALEEMIEKLKECYYTSEVTGVNVKFEPIQYLESYKNDGSVVKTHPEYEISITVEE